MSESKFVVVSTVLGDGSVVHDVEVHADDGTTQHLAWCPAERCAQELARTLGMVTKAILDQGSDHDVVKVASAVRNALEDAARG